MRLHSRTRLLGTCSLSLVLLACQGLGPDHATEADLPSVLADSDDSAAAPMELEEGQDSPWHYVAAKYDADGDGRITRQECNRDNFDALDYNGDGILSREDYTEERDSTRTMMRERRGQAMLFTFFQADDDAHTLERVELDWAFGEYDEDQDGSITRAEFTGLAREKRHELSSEVGMGRMMLGEVRPWPALLAAMDADGDHLLALSEVQAFFDGGADLDGVWTLENRTRPTHGSPRDRGQPSSGVKVGTVAPDFVLAPPDGGEAVRLSSFRGKRPVALIFGSYT